jgi:hypothetical protein
MAFAGRRIDRRFTGDIHLNGGLARRGYAVAYWRCS